MKSMCCSPLFISITHSETNQRFDPFLNFDFKGLIKKNKKTMK